jgi:uncharacterized protein
MRLKEDYDGAEPAASSVATLNALTLAHLADDRTAEAQARRTLASFAARLSEHGRVVPMMSVALQAFHAGFAQVVVVGEPDSPGTGCLLDTLATTYRPFALVVPLASGSSDGLGRLLPWTAAMRERQGHATAYVCRDFSCREPVTTAEALAALL